VSGPWIDVDGGVGGTAVGLESLEAGAGQLALVATELAGVLAVVVAVAAAPDLQLSAPLSPVTAARAEVALAWVVGPGGLSGHLAGATALAAATVTAIAAYHEVTSVVSDAIDRARDEMLYAVGRCSPGLAVGVLTLHGAGVDVGGALNHALFDLPQLADLAGGVRGLVGGLSDALPTALVLQAGRAAAHPTEGRDDPDGYSRSVSALAGSAALLGLLSEAGQARVVAEPTARPGARAPSSLATLARDHSNLSDGQAYPGHVRVVEMPQEHGSTWVVEISGTQVWNPKAGDNPYDATTDVLEMAGGSTVLAQGVEAALRAAQAQSGHDASADPVLLAGHSLGGIVSAGLASSPEFTRRHRVTHVVTMGSPVARMPVPSDIQVLSMEHSQDPVPRLEGHSNPDRRSWVTVTRDLRGDSDRVSTGSGAHAIFEYVETAAAVDASTDASVQEWREGSRQFFRCSPGTTPVVRDYRIERIAPGP
jgi:hypothetical protein